MMSTTKTFRGKLLVDTHDGRFEGQVRGGDWKTQGEAFKGEISRQQRGKCGPDGSTGTNSSRGGPNRWAGTDFAGSTQQVWGE